MSIVDKMGGFNTVVGFNQLFVNALVSFAQNRTDPGAFAAEMLGLDSGTSLDDMHADIMDAIGGSLEATQKLHLDFAIVQAKTALIQTRGYAADPDMYDASNIVRTADAAFTSALHFGERILSGSDDVGASSVVAAISAVSIALNARLTVTAEVEDGAFGKETVHATVEQARAFFAEAKTAYVDALDIDVSTTTKTWMGTVEKYIFTVTSDYADDAVVRKLLAGEEVNPGYGNWARDAAVYDLSAGHDKHVVHLAPGDKFAIANDFFHDSMFLGFGRPSSPDANWMLEVDNLLDRVVIQVYMGEVIKRAALEDAGFGAEGENLADLTAAYDALLDGEQIIDGAHKSSVLQGTNGNDFINGKDYDDTLFGYGDEDVLKGGEGRDRMDGGAGADVLFGGLAQYGNGTDGDRDVFVFRNPESVDVVKQYEQGIDKIALDQRVFDDVDWIEINGQQVLADGALGYGLQNAGNGHSLIQDGGALYYIEDNGTQTHFASLEAAGQLDSLDFIMA